MISYQNISDHELAEMKWMFLVQAGSITGPGELSSISSEILSSLVGISDLHFSFTNEYANDYFHIQTAFVARKDFRCFELLAMTFQVGKKSSCI